MDAGAVSAISAGLSTRIISDDTGKGYVSSIRTMQKIIVKNPIVFPVENYPFERGDDGTILIYTNVNIVKGVYKWVLPITLDNVKKLFALLSVDDSLPQEKKQRRRRGDDGPLTIPQEDEEVAVADEDVVEDVPVVGPLVIDLVNTNPGKDKVTIVSGSMMNFASALKWLHKFVNADIGKVRYRMSEEVKDEISSITATYKRDVGDKRKRGIMKVREGKDPVSLSGYEHICKYLYQKQPVGHRGRWSESIFVNLYLRLQCATIGRTDNISSLLITHLEWDCDALTITFSTTKSDKEGERTNERKHIYASTDMPHVCVFLALAIFIW
jgi:hypothetical protein